MRSTIIFHAKAIASSRFPKIIDRSLLVRGDDFFCGLCIATSRIDIKRFRVYPEFAYEFVSVVNIIIAFTFLPVVILDYIYGAPAAQNPFFEFCVCAAS